MVRLPSVVHGSIRGNDLSVETKASSEVQAVGEGVADLDGKFAGGADEVVGRDETDDALGEKAIPGLQRCAGAGFGELVLAVAAQDRGGDLDGEVRGGEEATIGTQDRASLR